MKCFAVSRVILALIYSYLTSKTMGDSSMEVPRAGK